MRNTCNVRDQHSASSNNKKFLELHNKINEDFTSEEIAHEVGMARSTYGKVKLGYYPAYDYRLNALKALVLSLYGDNYAA